MTMISHASLIRANSVSDFELENLDKQAEISDSYIESFGIDDARNLVKLSYQTPEAADTKVLVVRTEFITLEAQNALLKLLEEPPLSTRLVFVLPPAFQVLPTLGSRLQDETQAGESAPDKNEVFAEFVVADYKDRISLIEKSAKQKDTDWQRSIKSGLIEYLKQGSFGGAKAEVEYVSRVLLTRGASNKMLLEHAALAIPPRLTL